MRLYPFRDRIAKFFLVVAHWWCVIFLKNYCRYQPGVAAERKGDGNDGAQIVGCIPKFGAWYEVVDWNIDVGVENVPEIENVVGEVGGDAGEAGAKYDSELVE